MTRVIAHRGASAAAPENTVEAFRLARTLGADWVELDARRTADDQVVVSHDPGLADGRNLVDLARADLPTSICDLADALDACEGMSVNVEIKNIIFEPDHDPSQRVADHVVALVTERNLVDRVLVSCFDLDTLDHVKAALPALPTAYLHMLPERGWDDLATRIAGGGHQALHPWDPLVDEAYLASARGAGLEVNVWTVNDPERMAALVALSVDGICTDMPDVARAVIGLPGA